MGCEQLPGEIKIDRQVFEALASDTRIAILKELDQRPKTVTELADSLNMAKSSVHEHLSKMSGVGLVEKKDSERKWTYYSLTQKGRKILHPHETTKILVLIGLSILAFLGGVSQILKLARLPAGGAAVREAAPAAVSTHAPQAAAKTGGNESLGGAAAAPATEPLILGTLLVCAGFLLGYFAYRIWRRSKR